MKKKAEPKVFTISWEDSNGELQSRSFPYRSTVKIGSLKDNHICLEGDVSRMHCTIGFFVSPLGKAGILLRDLGSLSGTFHHDVRVLESPISSGDSVRVGEYSLKVSF